MTTASVGFHGLNFGSGGVNSGVYGAALVVSPVWDAPEQDILFSRIYFTPLLKETNFQIGIQWTIRFE